MSKTQTLYSGLSFDEAAAAFQEFATWFSQRMTEVALAFNTAFYARPRTSWEMRALRQGNAEAARRHHDPRRRVGATAAVVLDNLDPVEVRRRRRKPSMG